MSSVLNNVFRALTNELNSKWPKYQGRLDTRSRQLDPLANIWQVAIALLVIVALVAVLGVVARKMQGVSKGSNGSLKIIDSVYLGPKERLSLVQVRKQRVLVGIHPQSMTKLMELGTEEGFEEIFSDALEEGHQATVTPSESQLATQAEQPRHWLDRVRNISGLKTA